MRPMKAKIHICLSVLILVALKSSVSFAFNSNFKNINTTKNNSFSGFWNTDLGLFQKMDEQNSKNLTQFRLFGSFDYALGKNTKLNFMPKLTFQTGHTQTIDESEKAQNKITLKQAALITKPLDFIELKAGALDQSKMHSSLLIDDRAFPSITSELFIFNSNNHDVSFIVEAAIPTASSLATDTKEKEKTPSFYHASLHSQIFKLYTITSLLRLGYFQYQDLPSTVAYNSSLAGNSVDKTTATENKFIYKYSGLEAQVHFTLEFTKYFTVEQKNEYIVNTDAPSDLNKAYFLSIAPYLDLNKNIKLFFEIGQFYIEPDASVAYYNSSYTFGNNNRQGYLVSSGVFFKNYGFKIKTGLTESRLIYKDPYQSNEKTFWFVLETSNAKI